MRHEIQGQAGEKSLQNALHARTPSPIHRIAHDGSKSESYPCEPLQGRLPTLRDAFTRERHTQRSILLGAVRCAVAVQCLPKNPGASKRTRTRKVSREVSSNNHNAREIMVECTGTSNLPRKRDRTSFPSALTKDHHTLALSRGSCPAPRISATTTYDAEANGFIMALPCNRWRLTFRKAAMCAGLLDSILSLNSSASLTWSYGSGSGNKERNEQYTKERRRARLRHRAGEANKILPSPPSALCGLCRGKDLRPVHRMDDGNCASKSHGRITAMLSPVLSLPSYATTIVNPQGYRGACPLPSVTQLRVLVDSAATKRGGSPAYCASPA